MSELDYPELLPEYKTSVPEKNAIEFVIFARRDNLAHIRWLNDWEEWVSDKELAELQRHHAWGCDFLSNCKDYFTVTEFMMARDGAALAPFGGLV